MTQEELDQIEETGTFGAEERVINGQRVRVPVLRDAGVLWTRDDEPCAVIDTNGERWRI